MKDRRWGQNTLLNIPLYSFFAAQCFASSFMPQIYYCEKCECEVKSPLRGLNDLFHYSMDERNDLRSLKTFSQQKIM